MISSSLTVQEQAVTMSDPVFSLPFQQSHESPFHTLTLMLGAVVGPEESCAHLGLLSVSISSSTDDCRERPGTHSSPDFVPGTVRGQVSPPSSVDVTAT